MYGEAGSNLAELEGHSARVLYTCTVPSLELSERAPPPNIPQSRPDGTRFVPETTVYVVVAAFWRKKKSMALEKNEASSSCQPRGGMRPYHQMSSCHMQFTSGPYVVQIWSRNTPEYVANETLAVHSANPHSGTHRRLPTLRLRHRGVCGTLNTKPLNPQP